MAVAACAYDELSPAQRDRVIALLKKHPDLKPIENGFGGSLPDDRSFFMAAATWPDLIRGDNDYAEDKSDPYEKKKTVLAPANYRDGLKHRGWHFQDNYFWDDTGPAGNLPSTPVVNAVSVVKMLVDQIKSDSDDTERAYALMWLFHLTGDIHQPLHAVSGVRRDFPDGDNGGNSVMILKAPGANEPLHATELHAFWDDLPGVSANARQSSDHLAKDVATALTFVGGLASVPLQASADSLDPQTWAAESFTMAKNDAYKLDIKEATVTPKAGTSKKPRVVLEAQISDAYHDQAMKDAQERVKLAGHRLALLLIQLVP